MTQDAERLFLEAVELPPAQRRIFLLEHCTTDELRREVESLLTGDESAESFLQSSIVEAAGSLQQLTDQPASPDIGPWRITRVLGRGGMGVVYAAERSDGLFSQQVAIKVIQHGQDQAALVARFESERRILAGLSHPNIACLFDGGTSSDGLPYLVMEYVDGVAISDYVRAHSLGVRQTVELFLAVCSGVEHAHRHFIVHRDIKPGNILVAGDGVVKLLDFGIARIMNDSTPSANTGTLALTLEYSSPEQVRGEPVTTATDVYSLGGVLYQLLTDATPLQLGQMPIVECLQAIIERAPRDPLSLRPAMGRDLSYIVLRALRKEPDRRYPSVEALRLDLERYLKGLPVEARGNSPVYLASRFLRRRWLPVTAATLVFASTVAGLVLSRRAQARAEYQSQVAEQARQAVTSMFDHQFNEGRPREALATLDKWLRLQREEYQARPDNKDARKLLGIYEERRCVMAAMYDPELASSSCEESIRLLEALSNTPSDDDLLRVNLARARSTLGKLRSKLGKADEGIALCRRSLDDIQVDRRDPGDSPRRRTEAILRLNLAEVLAAANRIEDAIRAYGESYRILRNVNRETEDGRAYIVLGVSGVRFSKILAKKNPAGAQKLMEDALGMLRLSADSPKATIQEWNEYANALNECPYPRLHNKEAALIYAKRAAEASGNDPSVLDTLAWAYYYVGDRTRALETERQARSAVTPGSPIGRTIEESMSRFEKSEP
jgi:serine/threonine protein kinase